MKKTVTFVLIIAMVMGCAATAFAGTYEPEVFNYLSLGDSTCDGYAIPDYFVPKYGDGTQTADDFCAFDCLVEDSTPYLVEQYLKTGHEKVNTKQYAVQGFRPYDYRVLLDPAFPMDDDFKWCHSYNPDGTLRYALLNTDAKDSVYEMDDEEIRSYFSGLMIPAVKNADLISIDVWSNDFMGWISPFFSGEVHPDIGQFLGNLNYIGSAEAVRSVILENLANLLPDKNYSLLPQDVKEFIDICACAYMDATLGMDQLLACIKDLNPDVQLILVEAFSLAGNTVIRLDGIDIPYGTIMSVLAELVNNYRKNISPYRSLYSIATFNGSGCETYFDKMVRPVESYDEDTKRIIRKILECMPETADPSLADGGEEAAFIRFHEALCRSDLAIYGTQDPTTWEYAQSPAAAKYLLHGPEGLSAEELQEAYDYWSTAGRLYMYFGCHPSLGGNASKAQAIIAAFKSGKTAKQAAADDAWEGLKKWTESMHEKRMDWEDKTFDFRMDVAEGLLKTTVVNLTLGKIIKNIITLPLKARCR